MIGWTLLQTSAVTNIVSTRVYHGLRPEGTAVPSINYYAAVPSINYYELGGGVRANGIEIQSFSINCRASTAGAARNLARSVLDLFTGTSGTGIYGTQNGFDIARASLRNDNGLVPETTDNVYNAPIDIAVAYAISTIS